MDVRLLFDGEVLSDREELKAWQADPVGFGLLFRGRLPTWKAWERYRWGDKVGRLEVTVDATMGLRRYGLILGTEQQLKD